MMLLQLYENTLNTFMMLLQLYENTEHIHDAFTVVWKHF